MAYEGNRNRRQHHQDRLGGLWGTRLSQMIELAGGTISL